MNSKSLGKDLTTSKENINILNLQNILKNTKIIFTRLKYNHKKDLHNLNTNISHSLQDINIYNQ